MLLESSTTAAQRRPPATTIQTVAPVVCDFIGCDEVADRDLDGMPACDAHATQYETWETEGERQAELAVERYYEGGWDTTGEYGLELAY